MADLIACRSPAARQLQPPVQRREPHQSREARAASLPAIRPVTVPTATGGRSRTPRGGRLRRRAHGMWPGTPPRRPPKRLPKMPARMQPKAPSGTWPVHQPEEGEAVARAASVVSNNSLLIRWRQNGLGQGVGGGGIPAAGGPRLAQRRAIPFGPIPLGGTQAPLPNEQGITGHPARVLEFRNLM